MEESVDEQDQQPGLSIRDCGRHRCGGFRTLDDGGRIARRSGDFDGHAEWFCKDVGNNRHVDSRDRVRGWEYRSKREQGISPRYFQWWCDLEHTERTFV